MKIFQILLLSLLCSNVSFAKNQTVTLQQILFKFIEANPKDSERFEHKVIELYRDDKNLLSHTLFSSDGDCSINQIEVGDYEIKGNQLIFYTYWAAGDRQGLWNYPYGVRKQIYTVDQKGIVKLKSAVMYIEDVLDYSSPSKPPQYLQFLNDFPQTKQERKVFDHYVQSMQTRYKARFVHGNERVALIKEVKGKLAKQIKTETEDWKEIYGGKVRM